MGRYSLVGLNPNTQYKRIFGVNVDKTNTVTFVDKKTSLPEIDKYTMQFEDLNELENDLFNNGIIDADVMLFVEYKHDGNKQTDILYKSDAEKFPFANELSTYVNQESKEFQAFYHSTVYGNNDTWLKTMHDYGYINDHLYEGIMNIKKYGYATIAEEETLKKEMSSYKTLRSIYIGTQKYKVGIKNYESDIDETIGTKIKEINDEIEELVYYGKTGHIK